MNGIGPSLELELRTWLTQLLCIWMLVQGPPLEAAQQRFHEKSLVVEPTVVGPAEGAPDAETNWSAAIGASFAQTAHSLAARWMTGWSALAAAEAAPERKAAAAGQPPKADLPSTDLPPGQVIPPPPQPPGAVAPVQSSSAPAPTRATDLANAAAKAAVVVAPPFNLLSISWQATNPAPAAVLTPIAAAVTKVYSYDACDPADKWKIYDPASPGSSDLAAITPAKGFWLDATGPVTLPEAGSVPASVEIPLCVGWNLIGFPKSSARPVAEALQLPPSLAWMMELTTIAGSGKVHQ